jgi:hypothetical protein
MALSATGTNYRDLQLGPAAGFGFRYDFQDLRRAFATQNALRLTENALQALMRHNSYLTTKRYINMARQLEGAVE